MNVDKHWYIIPTLMSLGTVRNALLPNVLKNLLTRHRYTHEMLNESAQEVSEVLEVSEVSQIQVCVFFLLLKFAELQYKIIFASYAKSSLMALVSVYFIVKLTHCENEAIDSANVAETFHVCCVAEQGNLISLQDVPAACSQKP